MDLLKHMGERFREIRKNKGYTLIDLEDWIGVNIAGLSRIENGNCMPPYSVYEDICRICGTTFGEFMSAYKWSYTEPKQNITEVDFSDDNKKVS